MYTQEEDLAFIQFIAKYGKSYASKHEHQRRADIFKANLKMIREENLKEGNTFTMSVNQYADMSEADFKNTKVNNVRSY